MLNLIFCFLFSAVSEAVISATKKTVVVEEKQSAAGPQLYLHMLKQPIVGELNRKNITPFTEVEPLLKIFLYPDLGYGELFSLLDMEKDSLATYKFHKFMIQILVRRINQECIDSNEELCCYLLSRYNMCSYEPVFIQNLHEWREELEASLTSQLARLDLSPKAYVSMERSPHLSKQGKIFLQGRSGVRSRQLTELEFIQESNKLPEALRRAVCIDTEKKEGGRRGFDAYCDETYGVSLCSSTPKEQYSIGRPPRLVAGAAPTMIAARKSGQEIGNWFSVTPQAVSQWFAKQYQKQPGEQEVLLNKNK